VAVDCFIFYSKELDSGSDGNGGQSGLYLHPLIKTLGTTPKVGEASPVYGMRTLRNQVNCRKWQSWNPITDHPAAGGTQPCPPWLLADMGLSGAPW
jgi:hypothetical protein